MCLGQSHGTPEPGNRRRGIIQRDQCLAGERGGHFLAHFEVPRFRIGRDLPKGAFGDGECGPRVAQVERKLAPLEQPVPGVERKWLVIHHVRDMVDDEPLSFDAWNRLLQRGELSLDLGDARAALTIAERALRQIAADPEPRHLEMREEVATAFTGKALVALDDPAAAIPRLRRAVALAEAHRDPELNPRLADTLVALAEACRRTGQANAALQAHARARAILEHHPRLASRYQSALERTRRQMVKVT